MTKQHPVFRALRLVCWVGVGSVGVDSQGSLSKQEDISAESWLGSVWWG